MNYNFLKQFADDIESGKKTQTIRKVGKRNPPSAGDVIKLYTGMRTKNCRLLAEVVCTSVCEIKIKPEFGEVLLRHTDGIHFAVFDSQKSLEKFARLDGFKTIDDFFEFFSDPKNLDEHGHFNGHLIDWGNDNAAF